VGQDKVPASLNKRELLHGLGSCLANYNAALERSSNKRIREEMARLNRALLPAKRLQREMPLPADDDRGLPFTEVEHFGELLGYLIDALESKIDDLQFELRNGPDFDEAIALNKYPREYADRWKAHSPFEWIAGRYLPELFKEQFGASPTFHRRKADDKPDSPLIRFVETALIELGISHRGRNYSREAIAKAVTDVRTGRVRKRGAADGVPDGPTVPLINFIERELIDLGIWNRKGEYSRVTIALAINEALTGKIRRLEDDQLDGPLISAVERALIRFGYRTAGTTTPKNE
jgi:hypothetical protein